MFYLAGDQHTYSFYVQILAISTNYRHYCQNGKSSRKSCPIKLPPNEIISSFFSPLIRFTIPGSTIIKVVKLKSFYNRSISLTPMKYLLPLMAIMAFLTKPLSLKRTHWPQFMSAILTMHGFVQIKSTLSKAQNWIHRIDHKTCKRRQAEKCF